MPQRKVSSKRQSSTTGAGRPRKVSKEGVAIIRKEADKKARSISAIHEGTFGSLLVEQAFKERGIKTNSLISISKRIEQRYFAEAAIKAQKV